MIQLSKNWKIRDKSRYESRDDHWLEHLKCSYSNKKRKSSNGKKNWVNYAMCYNCYATAPEKVQRKAKFILNSVNNGI